MRFVGTSSSEEQTRRKALDKSSCAEEADAEPDAECWVGTGKTGADGGCQCGDAELELILQMILVQPRASTHELVFNM